MKEQKPSRKPLIYYGIIMFVVILLLNALVFPSLMELQVREVGYNAFLAMLDSGAVKEVAPAETAGQLTYQATQEQRRQPGGDDAAGIARSGAAAPRPL